MANKESNSYNLRDVKTNISTIGMNKDVDPQLLKQGEYTHAINATINNHDGEITFIQNEQSFTKCLKTSLPYISSSPLQYGKHIVFSGDEQDSEIGIFDSNNCTYEKVINSVCLNFKHKYPPKAISQIINNCDEVCYIVDNYNPNKYLNFNDIPFITITDPNGNEQTTEKVDCARLRLTPLIKVPCIEVSRSKAGGKLPNGSYQVAIAYTDKAATISIAGTQVTQRTTDIYGTSVAVPIFSHSNAGGGVSAEITNIDTNFDYYIVYLIATIQDVRVVYEVGIYNTSQTNVEINNIATLAKIDLSEVFTKSVIYQSSRDIVSIDDRALLIGAKTRPRINYQPLANRIRTSWVAYAVPKDYYKNGGTKVGNMRDEVYSYGIEWLWNTGDYTEAFHIPGPVANSSDFDLIGGFDGYEAYDTSCDNDTPKYQWQVYNNAGGYISERTVLDCDELELGSGYTGFWQSEEKYPNNKEVYEELANQNIRHHKMPDICKVPYTVDGHPVILGAKFQNIQRPLDCDGKPINEIVGYRIVRGDRTNNKSILGKGLLFNIGEYNTPDSTDEKILYPNYPFNDLSDDPFLSKKLIRRGKDRKSAIWFQKDIFSFHSPSFAGFEARKTFGTDLFIEGEFSGNCSTTFKESYQHPKNVLLTDKALIVAYIIGIGGALLDTNQERIFETYGEGTSISSPTIATAWTVYNTAVNTANLLLSPLKELALAAARTQLRLSLIAATQLPSLGVSPVYGKVSFKEILKDNGFSNIPDILKSVNSLAIFTHYFNIHSREALEVIKTFSNFQQHAYQSNSYGEYTDFECYTRGEHRRRISDVSYLYPGYQTFNNQKINNFDRESSVVFKVSKDLKNPLITDTSRKEMNAANACETKKYESKVSSHYASIRRSLPSQYGQINAIKYLDTGYCDNNLDGDKFNTGPVFGGDTYLTKYTVKRKFQYFTQTANGNANGYEFDYSRYPNIAYPTYWMNSEEYELGDILNLDFDGTINLPSSEYNLSCPGKGFFSKRDNYFYLSNNGVIDFLVESEYNLDLRDWNDNEGRRHYDSREYTDLNTIFRQDFHDVDNDHLYDTSYSKQITENSIVPQSIDYSCSIEEECYTNYPNKLLYSLQYQGGKLDRWRNFLPLNYYDFPRNTGNLILTKALDKNNIAFIFDQSSPWYITARDTLTTSEGNKIILGDGGLFTPPPRPVLSTDTLYGAADHNCSVNTQYGLAYLSEKQSRIYLMNGTKLTELNQFGLNWWLKENMSFRIKDDFPTVSTDSPILGIGYLISFDNKDELYYVTKRDIKLNPEYKGQITYNESNGKFYLGPKVVKTSNPLYFTDCSWTLSYSPKLQHWISFHDYKPDAYLQTETSLLSIKESTIYKHRDTCEHYCFFYDTQYSFDIEYVINNLQQTSSLSSIEYSIECYKYFNSCRDSHHLLDYNFNRAFIYNSEQISGNLRLNVQSKNKISQVNFYPVVTTEYIDIECSKVEQKYRFNQFWDVTKNRSEFNTDYIQVLSTEENGYKYSPNELYIDYSKPIYQRAKLRHNWNKVYLSRVDKDKEMNKIICKFLNSKQLISPR